MLTAPDTLHLDEVGTRRPLAVSAGAALAVTAALVAAPAAPARAPAKVSIHEYRLPAAKLATLRKRWLDRLAARHAAGSWAPMRVRLGDRDLRLMGLPPKRVLLRRRYRVPTVVHRSGRMVRLAGSHAWRSAGARPSTASAGPVTYAGAGFFGIRPGAWLLLLSGNSVSWCSMAHVYGSPGSYEISTAGHCGKPGDVATVIGATGNRSPVLLDFGTFKTSHDNGLGDDWALISVASQYQTLVTPTMAFWGGPIGMYRAEGQVLGAQLERWPPTVSVTPDPNLVQQIVHYGHGTGIGAGGTPRSGTAIAWARTHYMFFGATAPGDSGSGANTLTGDRLGANRQAAGIMTHLYIDPLMRKGLGVMGGTRATQVPATLADGQILPYPAPTPLLP